MTYVNDRCPNCFKYKFFFGDYASLQMCNCPKDEIRTIYVETDGVYKENRKLELEIESKNAVIEELEKANARLEQENGEIEYAFNYAFHILNLKKEKIKELEGKLNEKESKMDCTISGNCRCWCCNIAP